MKKYYLIGATVTFMVIFNLGYVFHDLLVGPWFHEQESAIAREEFIIPAIAVAFMIYTVIQAYLLHVFYSFASVRYQWSLTRIALTFGALIGFLWDGLQGGLIEYATMNMPFAVFLVDSSYHTCEGALTAWLLSLFYRRFVIA
jgi:hypothetical protein